MTTKQFLSGACMAAFITGTVLVQGQKADAAAKKVYVTRGESVTIKVKKATRKTKWKSSKKKIIKLTGGKNSLTIKGNVPEEEKPLAKVPSGYLSVIKEKGV